MLDKQQNLRANFPAFLDRLASLPDGLPNLHIGVISTDMGTKGSASPTPGPAIGQPGFGGCAGTGKGGALQVGAATLTGNFLVDLAQPDGTRLRNYNGTLEATFSQMASLGAGGCGFEQPLAALRAALDGHPSNAGFLRADALLGIVFLTDEDDCSFQNPTLIGPESPALGAQQSFRCTRFGVRCAVGGQTSDAMNQIGPKLQCGAADGAGRLDDVAAHRSFLAGLKSDPSRVMVSAIMGTPEPFSVELRPSPGGGPSLPALAHSCTYQGSVGPEVADPGVRLKALLDGFPNRSTFTTICQQDLSDGLTLIGELVAGAIGSPCIDEVLADTDPDQPGTQPDCIVEDVVGSTATPVPSCAVAPLETCWALAQDAAVCPSVPQNLTLTVRRTTTPDPATVTRMRCLVE